MLTLGAVLPRTLMLGVRFRAGKLAIPAMPTWARVIGGTIRGLLFGIAVFLVLHRERSAATTRPHDRALGPRVDGPPVTARNPDMRAAHHLGRQASDARAPISRRLGLSALVALPLAAAVAVAAFAAPPRAPSPYCLHVEAMVMAAVQPMPDWQTVASEEAQARMGAGFTGVPDDLQDHWLRVSEWTEAMYDADGWVVPSGPVVKSLQVVLSDAQERCGWTGD